MKKMLIWGMWTEQHSWGCCSAQVRGTMSLSTEFAAATAKSLQSCPTLCDPIDGLLPGSSVPGILQARTLEWVAISFSNEWKWKVKVKSLSGVWLLATPWTVAYHAPPSMGFSIQEYWSGLPFPSPGNLPNPGIEHRSPTLQADTLPSELWIWDGDIILEYPGGLHVIMRVPKYREGWECFSVSQSVACEPSA